MLPYPPLHFLLHKALENIENCVKGSRSVDVVKPLRAHWVPFLEITNI